MKLTGRTATRTLAFVNRCRAEMGRAPITKLPLGFQSDGRACPIANSLRDVGIRNIFVPGWADEPILVFDTRHVHTFHKPDYVQDFIVAFDRGRIPELIAA